MMGRPVEMDVHSSFMESAPGEPGKSTSVQCLYCNQIRAKNTTRQKAHLTTCEGYLRARSEAALLQAATATAEDDDDADEDDHDEPNTGYPDPSSFDPASASASANNTHTTLGFTPNPRINAPQAHVPPSHDAPALDGTPAPKKQKTKRSSMYPGGPDIPLHEVHAAFEEVMVNEDAKTLSAKCRYCGKTRAKNTSRQREHLLVCPNYKHILREKIPANNLLNQFDSEDVASSLFVPEPKLELDFRMSIRVKPKLNLGSGSFGAISWVTCLGGTWAGRWGQGTVVKGGGQDMQTQVSDRATSISSRYLLQTNDEDPAAIICNIKGWLVGEKEVMERLQDPVAADNVAASRYKFRVNMELETGDNRYPDLTHGMWVGSGCQRGTEVVYDFYRLG